MKNIIRTLILALVAVTTYLLLNGVDGFETKVDIDGNAVEGRYVVVDTPDHVYSASATEAKIFGRTSIKCSEDKFQELRKLGYKVYKVRVYEKTMGSAPCEEKKCPLEEDDDIAIINPDQPVGDLVPELSDRLTWGTKAIGSTKISIDASGIVVAVADTGVDKDHVDLKSQLVGGMNFTNWGTPDNYNDVDGHGTHVSGTVAAAYNDTGVISASGRIPAKLLAVKVLGDDGRGFSDWIANGIDWSVEQGASIINMSLGTPGKFGNDPIIDAAIQRALNRGVLVVIAAGNEGSIVGNPARTNPRAIVVSALTRGLDLASFSNSGPEVDFAAPGDDILSTCPGSTYCRLSGTSMAAPHVAGALAVALAAGKSTLEAKDLGMPKEFQGKGLISLPKTLNAK